jgi:hypothetical protein
MPGPTPQVPFDEALAQLRLTWLEAYVAANPGLQFTLTPGEVVTDAPLYLKGLALDLTQPESSPRRQTGILAGDLERLIDLTAGAELSRALAQAKSTADLHRVTEEIKIQTPVLGPAITARLREEYRMAPARQPVAGRGLGD